MKVELGSAERLAGRWIDFLAAHHRPTAEHCHRVAQIALRLAVQLHPWSDDALQTLAIGALLHDIGKVRIPAAVLDKPDELDVDEWKLMKQHPIHSAFFLSGFPSLEPAISIVRHHHERWDGKGYPANQKGDEIPLGARIVAIADAYDCMRSVRPYKPPLSHIQACHELQGCAGSQFDPEIVGAFLCVPAEEWNGLY